MNPGICDGCKRQVEHRVYLEEDFDPEDNIGHYPLDLCEDCILTYSKYYDREGLRGVYKRCREK
jgi:hypothetical protein